MQLRPQVSGKIDRVLLKQGEQVSAGQLLFVLDKRPFQAPLEQAKAKLQQDHATMAYNQAQTKRYAELQKAGVISIEQAQGQAATAKASVASVQADEAAVESAQLNLAYTDIVLPISAQAGVILVNLGNVVEANTTTLTTLLAPYANNPHSLSQLYVAANDGKLVPLDTVSQVIPGVGPLTVNHLGQLPAVTVSFNLRRGVAPGDATTAVTGVVGRLVPPDVLGTFQGTAQAFLQSFAGLGLLLAAAISTGCSARGSRHERPSEGPLLRTENRENGRCVRLHIKTELQPGGRRHQSRVPGRIENDFDCDLLHVGKAREFAFDVGF